jgi:hypothetical protein
VAAHRRKPRRDRTPARGEGAAGAPGPAGWRRPEAILGAVVLAAAFAARVLFVRATPDRAWPHGVFFKGDAGLWVEYARALLAGRPFELDLPIHPPGTAYLIAWLWDGADAGIGGLKIFWALLGAGVVLLVYVAALRSFGLVVAAIAATACAASTGLIVLSGSLDSEMPYLVLAVGTLCFFESLRDRPGPTVVAAWSVLHGLACLFRVEHALFYGLFLGLLVVLWRRAGTGAGAVLKGVAVSLLVFALPLVPWHIEAWRSVRRFNTEAQPDDPSQLAVRRVARSLAWMPWDEAARAERDRLPAFARDAASAFVAATVLHRGDREVRAEDLRILDEAFAYRPRPLGRAPFVSLYGPLNFALANHPRSPGGFSRAALEEPPPLVAQPGRYPPGLVQGLPPPDLSFVYPPHVRLVNDGYALGWQWIRARGVAGALAHAGRKLRLFWSGAALGFTGFDVPLGLPRLRRAVDLAVPEPGWLSGAWSAVLTVACGLGLAAGRGRVALLPWLLFLFSKLAVTIAFFGYARQGAAVFPVVALLAALAAARWIPWVSRLPPGQIVRAAGLVLLMATAAEGVRALHPPSLRVDGRPLDAGDTEDVHKDQRIDAP